MAAANTRWCVACHSEHSKNNTGPPADEKTALGFVKLEIWMLCASCIMHEGNKSFQDLTLRGERIFYCLPCKYLFSVTISDVTLQCTVRYG
jgi:hypothetical protein